MKKLIFILIAFRILSDIQGQQIASYSQYMVNGLILNPAYAGSKEILAFTAVARKQWTGVKGSPETQTIAVHTPLTRNHISLGGFIINETIGVESRQEINAVYSYRLFLPKGKLSLGLLAGISNYRAIYGGLRLEENNDPNFNDLTQPFTIPNLGFGMYWCNEYYYLGFSIPKFLNTYFYNGYREPGAYYKNHYLFTGGFLYRINDKIAVKPNTLVKLTGGSTLEIDVNANIYYNSLSLGFSYRTYNGFNLLFEVEITRNLKMGYSYDISNKHFRTTSTGTHEISLNYLLKRKVVKSVCPRYF